MFTKLPRVLNYGNPASKLAPLNRGLVGWWPNLPQGRGGLRILDRVGKNHGTLVNGTLWSGNKPPGRYGSLGFDGTNDYVDMGTASRTSALNFNAQDFSFAFWLLDGISSDTGFQLNKSSGTGTNGYEFLANLGGLSGKWGWRINSANGCQSATTHNDGKWHHVVCTFVHSTLAMKMYIDGVLDTSVTSGETVAGNSSASFQLGARAGATITTAIKMDDVRVYTRALSGSDASQLYNASRTGYQRELNRLDRPWILKAAASGGAFSLAIGSGSYAITGHTVGLVHSRKLAIGSGSYIVTGHTVGFKKTNHLAIASGSYSINGHSVTLTYSGAGGPTHTLTVGGGAYTISGHTVGFKAARKLAAATGSYMIGGHSVGLRAARKLAAATGSYIVSGHTVGFVKHKVLPVGGGVYAISGHDVMLIWSGATISVSFGYTVPDNQLHYTVPNNQLHYTLGSP